MPVLTTTPALWRCIGLLSIGLLSLGALRAQALETAAAYGERVVRAEASWPDGLAPLPAAPPAAPVEERDAYRQALDTALQAGGPYQSGLAEPLQGLARWQWAQGDLNSARDLLGRALQVVRINDGLNSARQLPLVQDLIGLSRASGDLAALDDRYAYLYFLNGSGQPPYTGDRWQATLSYLRWQREALRIGLEGSAGARRRLLELVAVNEDLLETGAAGEPALAPGRRWQLVQSQLRNLYLLQARIPDADTFIAPMDHSRYYGLPGRDPLEAERQRLERLRRSGLFRGRELLEAFASSQAPGSTLAREARLALADWYQWHGSIRQAAALYRELATELAAAGDTVTLARWFGEAVELPDNGAFWQAPGDGEEPPATVTARFDVDASGRVRDVETAGVGEEDEVAAGRLRRELYDTRFRPRFEGAEPVASDGLTRAYLWLPLRRSR